MVFVKSWEDFEIAAENMYMANPATCRYTMKYIHTKGHILLKMTDNVKVMNAADETRRDRFHLVHVLMFCFSPPFSLQCIQYKAENMPDLKKIEKFSGNLMGHMASKE